MCNSITLGQYFQNDLSVERSIYDDVAAYQLNSLNQNLNVLGRKICIVPYGMKTIKSGQQWSYSQLSVSRAASGTGPDCPSLREVSGLC